MIDIPQYVLASCFTAEQAAALILGIDQDNATGHENEEYGKLLVCMRESYDQAVTYFVDCLEEGVALNPCPRMLESIGLEVRVKLLWQNSDDFCLENEEKFIGFENQKFTRGELERWIFEMGIKSAYQFTKQNVNFSSPPTKSKKTFSTKERKKLLGIIFWIIKTWYEYNHYSQAVVIAVKVKKDLADCGFDIDEKFVSDRIGEAFDLYCGTLKNNKSSFGENFLTTAELHALLRILLGLAICCYKYDSTKSKSHATPDIQKDLQVVGIEITDDTIRKYLKMASVLEKELQAGMHKN